MASTRVAVEPEVLKWARESIGLNVAAAARRIPVSESVLEQWEAGDRQPTIKQLRNAAKAYKRPVAVLLLPDVPSDFQPLRDFRRPSGAPETPSYRFLAEIRRAHAQREVLLELAQLIPLLGDIPEPPAASLHEHVEPAGSRLRESLHVSYAEQFRFSSPDEALRLWIQAVERLGVIVIQTSGVDRNEVKGFSIGERPRPVVGLNGSDWPRQRIFTLMHELVHVALRAGGICDLHEVQPDEPVTSDEEVEHFCNAVAASILMPAAMVMKNRVIQRASADTEWTLEQINDFARDFQVSGESFLLRMISLHRASWELYWQLKPEIDEAYEEAWTRRREEQRQREGGPSYYTIKARDLGRSYVHDVLEAYGSRRISSVDVSDYLGIKYNQLGKLKDVVGR